MTAPVQHVLCGDGLELMRDSVANREFASVITDPPYSEHVHANGRRRETGGGYGEARELEFASLTPEVRDAAAREFERIARRWVVVFSDLEGIHGWIAALENAGLEYVRTCIWVKPGGTPQFTGDRPASHAEAIVVAHQTKANGKPMKKRWNGGGRSNVFTAPPLRVQRCHTAQKPLKLMRTLVELFTDENELVLDPFAGSGTTGVACKQLARGFLGFEKLTDNADVARDRICATRTDLPFLREHA